MRNIYSNGEAIFSLVDGERVSVFSDSSVNFYIQVGRPNTASQWKLAETIAPGAIWTSSTVDGPTVCRLLATEALVHYEIGADPKTGSGLWGTIGGDLSAQADLDARFSDLEDTYVYYEIYQSIGSGTAGTITVPTGADILLGHYSGGADCVLVALDGAGLPSDQSPRTVGGAVVTSTLTDGGDYAFSGVPSAYPVALVYFIRIPLSLNGNVDATKIVQCWDTAEALNISFKPNGSVSAVNVQAAIEELDTDKLSSVAVSSPLSGNGTSGSPITAPVFVGSGITHAPGLVPDPGVVAGTSKFLREDGSWQAPMGGSGTVTSVTAGDGLTQSGTSTVNPTLDVVSHAGSAGTIGTLSVFADSIGVDLGNTGTTACAGNDARLFGDAPSNGTTYGRKDGAWVATGSSSSGVSGLSAIDFGAFPGSNTASVSVTGQTGILAGSVCSARIIASATSDHTVNDHVYASSLIGILTGSIIPGDGFTIYAGSEEKFHGTFNVQWVWS